MGAVFNEWSGVCRSWRIWVSLALQDILLRYRGSVLGPLWITISTAVTVYSMGFLYGILFKIDRQSYLPYFAAGMIAWSFLSLVINESTKILLDSKHFLENVRLPPVLYIFRMVFRNVIIFGHNLLVYLSIILFFQLEMNWAFLLLVPSFLVLALNCVFYGTIIAFVSTRFPDVGSIVSSLLQVLFFITPIMWTPETLPEKYQLFLKLNPFLHLVNLIRNPLLGLSFDGIDAFAISLITAFGALLFSSTLKAYRNRVVFWL